MSEEQERSEYERLLLAFLGWKGPGPAIRPTGPAPTLSSVRVEAWPDPRFGTKCHKRGMSGNRKDDQKSE